MGRILVPPDKLMEVADWFLQGKHEMERMLNFLSGRIDFVQQGWSGATQERFFQEFQVSRQSMSVTIERLSTVAQELIFISKNFTQVDGEKVVLDVPGNGKPTEAEIAATQWWGKVENEIDYASEVGKEFVLGASAAFTEDVTLGILHKNYDSDHPFANTLGGLAGHTFASVLGILGTVVGGAGEAGSFALDLTGIGAIVGVPAGVLSVGMMAAGSNLAFKGISGGFEQTKDMYRLMNEKDAKAAETSKPSGVKTEKNTHSEGKEQTTGKKFSEMDSEEQLKIAKDYAQKSPIEIPENATMKPKSMKDGYEQITYNWRDDTYRYEVRWHTRTSGAPEDQGNTWVIQRTVPGTGGQKPKTFFKIGENEWVEGYKWYDAIAARKQGTATSEQVRILDQGHWKE